MKKPAKTVKIRAAKKSTAKKSTAKMINATATIKVPKKMKTLINATTPLTLTITHEHVKRATCGSQASCVIAQALADHYGAMVDGFRVGSNRTLIITGDRIVRYTTPKRLSNSLLVFDKTGIWELPPGDYTLLPFKRPPNRWHKAKREGGKQDVFRGTPAQPTRFAESICQLARAA